VIISLAVDRLRRQNKVEPETFSNIINAAAIN